MNTPPPPILSAVPVHAGIEEWMAVALTDGMSAEERRLFEDHLAGCASCRDLYAEENAMSQTIQDAFATVRPLPGFARRLAAAFRRRRGAAWGERLRHAWQYAWSLPSVRVLGGTAVVLGLVGLGGSLTHEWPGTTPTWRRPETVTALEANGLVAEASGRVDFLKRAENAKDARGSVRAARRQLSDQKTLDQPTSLSSVGGTVSSLSGLSAANTYRGSTVINGGTLELGVEAASAKASGTVDKFIRASDSEAPAERSRLGGAIAASDGFVNAQSAPVAAAPAAPSLPSPVTAPSSPNAPAATAPAQDARKLIRNANVELEVAAFTPAVDALGVAAQAGGGYVATVDSSRLPNGKLRGTIVIKVLPEHLDAFLSRLRELGEVKGQTLSTEDVTKDYFDTDARLRNAKRMEDRLLKLLDDAKGKLTEILQVEKELGRVREDIEKMQGELQLYDAEVRFATVTIDLHEKDLQQPAKFLLHQTADLSLLTGDVEKTYAAARQAAEDAHAQIETSDLVRRDDGRVTATLRLLLAPATADSVIGQVKALARVQDYKMRGERVAQNGSPADADPAVDTAKLERAPVNFNLTIAHDEESHRQVSLTLSAADPANVFEQARAAGVAAGGEIVQANFNRTQGNHGSGVLVLRLPATREKGLLETVHGWGRVSDLSVQRDNYAAPDAEAAPVSLTLNLGDADNEPAVQQTSVGVLCTGVTERQIEARKLAAAAGAQVRSASFDTEADGGEVAALVFRLPLRACAGFVERIKGLGEVKELTMHRQTGPGAVADDSAPAEVSVRLYSLGRVVADESGLGATIRRTLAQGVGALMWSLRMIGVAVAFLAPWVGAVAVVVWVGRLIARRKKG